MSAPKPSKRKRTRILLVDDHPLVRQAVRASLEREGDLVVCGEADDRDSALEAIAACRPKLVIVDIGLAHSDGLELIRDIRGRHPEVLTLALSMRDESIYGERAVQAGARGYITKQDAVTKVIQAVRHVLAGQIYLSQSVVAQIASRLDTPLPAPGLRAVEGLSGQELEILQLLGVAPTTPKDAPAESIESAAPQPDPATTPEKAVSGDTAFILQAAIRTVGDPKHPNAGHSTSARKRD